MLGSLCVFCNNEKCGVVVNYPFVVGGTEKGSEYAFSLMYSLRRRFAMQVTYQLNTRN